MISPLAWDRMQRISSAILLSYTQVRSSFSCNNATLFKNKLLSYADLSRIRNNLPDPDRNFKIEIKEKAGSILDPICSTFKLEFKTKIKILKKMFM